MSIKESGTRHWIIINLSAIVTMALLIGCQRNPDEISAGNKNDSSEFKNDNYKSSSHDSTESKTSDHANNYDDSRFIASAIIDTEPVNFINAQAGTVYVKLMYNTLSIVFGSPKGGIRITLVAPDNFAEKEYKVRFVEKSSMENVQMTFVTPDQKIFEALGRKGSGSVKITKMTDTYITGTFSGIFMLQGENSQPVNIKNGKFYASFTPEEPDDDIRAIR